MKKKAKKTTRSKRPKSKLLRLTVSTKLHQELVARARRDGLTKTELVRVILRDALLQVPLDFGDESRAPKITNYAGTRH